MGRIRSSIEKLRLNATGKSSRRWVAGGVLLAMFGLLGGCTSLTGFYFYPKQSWLQTPEDLGIRYDDVYLQTHDGTQVHGWWMNGLVDERADSDRLDGAVQERPMVLFLHGNGENISTHMRSVAWLVYEGVDVFALDYRGYGASDGAAQLPAVLQDVEAAAGWLRRQFPDRRLVVLGQSFGGGLAVIFGHQAAEKYQISSVVAESAPYAYSEAAREILSRNWLGLVVWPFAWLLPTEWDPGKFTGEYPVPILLLHSKEDGVVAYHHGRDLLKAIGAAACWQETTGPHIGGFASEAVRAKTLEFIEITQC